MAIKLIFDTRHQIASMNNKRHEREKRKAKKEKKNADDTFVCLLYPTHKQLER